MTLSSNTKMLAHAANRAKEHPHYLGWVFARYREIEHISEHKLAELLSITGRDLPRLELCLRPRVDHFGEDIQQISTKFNVDAVALAKAVRLVESVESMANTDTNMVAAESGFLMAARTRKRTRARRGKEDHDDQSES